MHPCMHGGDLVDELWKKEKSALSTGREKLPWLCSSWIFNLNELTKRSNRESINKLMIN
jgi:hypothetical protein